MINSTDTIQSNNDEMQHVIGSKMEEQKGTLVKVHISNMKPPAIERAVRHINSQHVEDLAQVFESSAFKQVTTMVGFYEGPRVKNSNFKDRGVVEIEVIGGNHTVQALKKSGYDGLLQVEVYHKISNILCLQIGYQHNEVHEHSRKTTLMDRCYLARRLLLKTRDTYRAEGPKIQMTKWRESMAELLSLSTTELHDKYRFILHAASLPNLTWDALVKVFNAWDSKLILKQPKGELSKNTLMVICKVKDDTKKRNLLEKLADGRLDFIQFKKECKRRDEHESLIPRKSSNDAATGLQVTEKLNDSSGIEYQGDSENDQSKTSHLDTVEEAGQYQDAWKEESSASKRQVVLEQQRSPKLQDKVKEHEQRISTLEVKLQKIEKTIKTLECRLLASELAASRARKAKVHPDLKRKGKTTEMEKSSNGNKKRRISEREKNTKQKHAQQQEKKQEVALVSDATMNKKGNREEATIALVEYKNSKFWLGKLKDNNIFQFCKKPFARKTDDGILFLTTIGSFTLHSTDQQSIDPTYIVHTFKGHQINFLIQKDTKIEEMKEKLESYCRLTVR